MTMLARIHAAPSSSMFAASLQVWAMTLYSLNRLWLRDAVSRGLDPPRRARDCAPPWCSRPLVYQPHHGKSELGEERDYFDGPSMFHRGVGTCIDVASYDAAALAELDDVDARPSIVGELPRFHCVVLLPSGATTDPTHGLRPGETISRWQSHL